MYRKKDKNNLVLDENLASLKYEGLSHDEAVDLQYQLHKEKISRYIYWAFTVIVFFFLIFFTNKRTWILTIPLFLIWLVVFIKRHKKHKLELNVWFGIPGSGKTTTATQLAVTAKRKGIQTYSNVPIEGCYALNPVEDLGNYRIENAQIIIDEAGIDYNNRSYKSMPKSNIEWLKLHRHYKCNVHVFSQSYEDMDITFRRLATRYYLLKRSIIPGLFLAYPIRRSIGINEMTQEICDKYRFDPKIIRFFTAKKIFGRKYWKHFDSYDAPVLPEKNFEIWNHGDVFKVSEAVDAKTEM